MCFGKTDPEQIWSWFVEVDLIRFFLSVAFRSRFEIDLRAIILEIDFWDNFTAV